MSILGSLIIGGVIGWLAAQLLGRSEGVFASIVIGIIGSLIGSILALLIGHRTMDYFSLSLSDLVWPFIGSLIFVGILNIFQNRSHNNTLYK